MIDEHEDDWVQDLAADQQPEEDVVSESDLDEADHSDDESDNDTDDQPEHVDNCLDKIRLLPQMPYQ